MVPLLREMLALFVLDLLLPVLRTLFEEAASIGLRTQQCDDETDANANTKAKTSATRFVTTSALFSSSTFCSCSFARVPTLKCMWKNKMKIIFAFLIRSHWIGPSLPLNLDRRAPNRNPMPNKRNEHKTRHNASETDDGLD